MDTQNSRYQHQRRETRDPSGFKTLFAIILIIFAIGWLANICGPRCGRCGKRWDSYDGSYCFACQAEQKRFDAYYR